MISQGNTHKLHIIYTFFVAAIGDSYPDHDPDRIECILFSSGEDPGIQINFPEPGAYSIKE